MTLPSGYLLRLDHPCTGWDASASLSVDRSGSKTKAERFETRCVSHNSILSFLATRAKRETLWLPTVRGLRGTPDQTGS